MLKLYYYPGACSLSDHIVLEWTGAPYELVAMSRTSVKSPDYLAINPGGTVPLLKHDGFLLTENVAILVYLAELYPDAKLLGDGTPRGRAEVVRWLAFINSDVHGAFKPIFSPLHYLPDETRRNDVVDAARVRVREFLVRLDAQLDGRDWLTGTRSIADPYLFVVTRWAIAKGVDMRGLDHLSRFADRMYADVGVRAALEAEEGRAAA